MERQGVPASEAALFIDGMRMRRSAYQALAGSIADPDTVGDRARQVVAAFAAAETEPLSSAVAPVTGSDTSQVISIDAAGNAVVMLQSVSVPFGSGVYLSDTGVLLNNRLSGFNAREGDANCIAPRKRPANTLVPAIAVRNGQLCLACATPGGPGQTGTLAQFMGRVLGRSEALTDAIAAPRWSVTRYGDWLIEDNASPAFIDAMRCANPEIKVVPWGSVNPGSIAAIQRGDGDWIGATDTRRDASVLAL